jgi:S1-C subfamily serine protease
VTHGGKVHPAFAVRVHPSEDLAELQVPGLAAPAVTLRSASTLKPGERVYAIGAPLSLELTISEGLISGLRHDTGGEIIQTSAAISPGSSGGGLFDQMGRLVGITTFKLRGGENVNFALPTDWFESMVPITPAAAASDGSNQPPTPAAKCERQASGLLAPAELSKLTIEGSMVLPRVLSLHVRNRTGCTLRAILVSVDGNAKEFWLSQSWDDPLRPGEARMFRGAEPPPDGWDRSRWRLSGAR